MCLPDGATLAMLVGIGTGTGTITLGARDPAAEAADRADERAFPLKMHC